MTGRSGIGRLHAQPPVSQLDAHTLPRLDIAGQEPLRELVLEQALDRAPERPRPVLRVEARVREELDRLVRDLEVNTLRVHAPLHLCEQETGDLLELVAVE